MASSTSIPASEAVHVLLSMLADGSSSIREASMSSLKKIAPLNPLCVFECFAVLSRGGREQFGNMAGVFQVMAFDVRSLDTRNVDSAFMVKLAKIATAELISPKYLQMLSIDELIRVSLQVVINKPSTRSIDDILNKFIPLVDNNEKLEDSGSNKNIKC